MIEKDLINEIDIAHKKSNQALAEKDIDTYVESFSDNLQYKQLNGKTINKKQLIKDTKSYFNRIRNFSGSYERKEFTIISNERINEHLIQHSKVGIRIFIFFTKTWTIQREGIYKWEKVNNRWRIIDVEIINESIV